MKCLIRIVVGFLSVFLASGQSELAEAEESDRLRCYSCTTQIGNIYGRKNYDCLNNVTAVNTVQCSKGYYCLTSYTVESGVVTNIKRSCQNPKSDHNQLDDEAPTQDGCISRHSTSSSTPSSTSCYFHCTTNNCNKVTPGTIQECPDECPSSCDLFTGQCIAPLRCVQCTSDSDAECETKTAATPCPRSTYNYCAATKVSVLNLEKQLIQTSVSKSCTSFPSSYRVPTVPCKFVSSSTRHDNNYIKYTCSNFCSTDGCNMKAPTGSPAIKEGTGLRCVVCYQEGNRGTGCEWLTLTTLCPSTATYCKATVSYYTSPLKNQRDNDGYGGSGSYSWGSYPLFGSSFADAQNANQDPDQPLYKLAFIRRECATEPVTSQCLTTDVPGVNLQYVSCQATCQSNGCNTGWPARPKCSQCDVTNRTYNSRQFENCRSNPYRARRCPSPVYKFCTTESNNTASNPEFARRVRRGCSIDEIETTCYDVPGAGGATVNHCQSACNTDGCNAGAIL